MRPSPSTTNFASMVSLCRVAMAFQMCEKLQLIHVAAQFRGHFKCADELVHGAGIGKHWYVKARLLLFPWQSLLTETCIRALR